MGLGQLPLYVRGFSILPVITSLNYSTVDTAGGAVVTITGTGLASATSCTVGGTSATIGTNTSTSLAFTMPAKTAGSYNVQVTTAGGTSGTLSIEAFNPSTLSNQQGWWKAPYFGAPWSDSSSSGFNLTAGTAPSVPGNLNGFNYAGFNGTSQYLNFSTTMDHYTNSDPSMRETACGLIYISSAVSDPGSGARYNGTCICAESAGVWGAVVVNQSGTYKLCHYGLGSTTTEVLTTIPTGQWVFAQWGYDGTNMWVKVGNGSRTNAAWSSTSGQPFPAGRTLKLGFGYSTAGYFAGNMAETIYYNADQTDANLTKIRNYMESRYALTPGSLS